MSQRLPSGDQIVEALDRMPAADVFRAFPDAQATYRQNEAAGRPLSKAPPPAILKRLNPKMWDTLDYEAHQVADQTRWMWGKEAYDGTKFEYVGVGKPFNARQPLLRSVAWKHFLPATDDDE